MIKGFFKKCRGIKDAKILILGLDTCGKTTILFKFLYGNRLNYVPTIGFNQDNYEFLGFDMNIWDLCGSTRMRPLWFHYFNNTNGLVFVVDSTNEDRIDEAAYELNNVLAENEMKNAILLVFANKQDLLSSMTAEEIRFRLQLDTISNRLWHIQCCSAFTGDGILEGFEWMAQQMKKTLKT